MVLTRSTLFFVYFIAVSAIIFIGVLPTLVMPRQAVIHASRFWSRCVFWGARVLAGQRFEIRGTPPQSGVLVASKHMSLWDTIALYLALYDAAFVLKRELLRIPFYGWYIKKAGIIAIDRGGHASALRKMAADSRAAFAAGRSVLIFPEGTRQLPGAAPAYKPGVAGLYGQIDVPCVPVALNSGLFWSGPLGFIKKPGAMVLEFLEPIPPGLKRQEFMATLETRIETATAKLVDEGRKALAARGIA
ncbi:MAG TPA: lysophospholipid acyltransferase family protein [Rhizomicrobium sp.]|jgi:1-acyl-sn-glycerol-3-phosphate acyltransferase|nr:lysophospholipid acyltransferase family protein [Rhizomicrobium sp.]